MGHNDKKKIGNSKGISTLEKFKLGGINQWISIKGEDLSNPVLLVLHGGPGGSEMPVFNRCNRDLQNIFTVVNWDQRGAGKSFSPSIPKDTMNVEQFMADTHELVEYLKIRLQKEKIFILGHSWGTLLGLTETYRHPENIYAYVGVGQMVNGQMNEQYGYNFVVETAKKNNDKSALKKLLGKAEFRDGSYVNGREGCRVERSVLGKYGGTMYDKSCMRKLLGMLLTSPDYTFTDKINWVRGQLFTLNIMSIDWVQNVDLPNQIEKIDVPVYFFAGRHDYTTPFELVENYCDSIQAPSKELVFFENSAHSPMYEEPHEFFEAMSMVRNHTQNCVLAKENA